MNYLKIFIKFIIKNTFLNKFNVEIFNFLLIQKIYLGIMVLLRLIIN